MHINDTYALRSVLRTVKAGSPVDPRVLNALIEAADQEVAQFEEMLETGSREWEARQEEAA
jgi:hypothetical protein